MEGRVNCPLCGFPDPHFMRDPEARDIILAMLLSSKGSAQVNPGNLGKKGVQPRKSCEASDKSPTSEEGRYIFLRPKRSWRSLLSPDDPHYVAPDDSPTAATESVRDFNFTRQDQAATGRTLVEPPAVRKKPAARQTTTGESRCQTPPLPLNLVSYSFTANTTTDEGPEEANGSRVSDEDDQEDNDSATRSSSTSSTEWLRDEGGSHRDAGVVGGPMHSTLINQNLSVENNYGNKYLEEPLEKRQRLSTLYSITPRDESTITSISANPIEPESPSGTPDDEDPCEDLSSIREPTTEEPSSRRELSTASEARPSSGMTTVSLGDTNRAEFQVDEQGHPVTASTACSEGTAETGDEDYFMWRRQTFCNGAWTVGRLEKI